MACACRVWCWQFGSQATVRGLRVCRAAVLCPGTPQQGWLTHVKATLGQTTEEG